MVVSRVDLVPVNHLRPPVAGLVPHRIVPLSFVLATLFQAFFDIHAAGDGSRITCGDVSTVGPKCPKPRSPGSPEIRSLLDGAAKRHGSALLRALATTLATTELTRPLNSLRPPHPSPPVSSLSTSNLEISVVVPVVGSK